ncbi:hypothetical protein [Nocardia sp. NPDC056000]|uniref:hypothetical protein n=1 Tax=Nocardia sp. NPDC056000 TaxID=3345674 RepID=UPI0035E16896
MAAMNHRDHARNLSGVQGLPGGLYDPAMMIAPDVYAASLRWRLVFAAMAVVFGAGVVFGVMLAQDGTQETSPNVCRAEEISRIDCVHVSTVVPTLAGVAR